jgi:transposase-like protein
MRKVPKSRLRVVGPEDATPEPGQLTLGMLEVAGVIREGLLALSVTAGMAVLGEMLQHDVERLVGARGRHDGERTAYRHGVEPSSLALGGRRVAVTKPRVRSVAGEELVLPTWRALAESDLLSELAVSRMLAGVSTRRYATAGLEPVGREVAEASRGTSKSAVSRRFVALTRRRLHELLARPVPEGIAVVFVDGLEIKGRAIVAALGIDRSGAKHLLGIAEGATENATLVTGLIEDLVERGLSAGEGLLFVIDGAKALRAAIRRCFADRALVHRCQVHKARNVTEHLPEAERPFLRRKIEAAWRDPDADRAERTLTALARSIERAHPGAARSLREGLHETLTITRLGLTSHDALWRTLRSTNPVEQAFSICRTEARNVKRWQSGEQALRWVAAGLAQASTGWRRLRGHRSMPVLLAGLKRHVDELEREVADRAAA